MGNIRARSPEEKEVKRKEIIKVVRRLMRRKNLEDISWNQIAKEAGMAKSTMYVYWKTREDIFLGLFEDSYYRFLNILEKRIAAEVTTPVDLAEIYCAELVKDPLLLPLLEQLHPLIERHSNLQTLFDFKMRTYERIGGFVEIISKALSFSQQQAYQFLTFLFSQTLGLYQMTNIPEGLAELIRDTPASVFKLDFLQSLKEHMIIFARGLEVSRQLV
ncbi:MAG: TetR/AcrR family transcriptional regulator [Chlorobiales bacterium]|nr:TetR/AcrR family transcriptional regulator [Chlorobiales bacterium]